MARTRTFTFPDLNFLGTALVLSAIGLMLIYSATYFNDPGLSIVHKQILWMIIGIALMAARCFDRYDRAYLNLRLFAQAVAIIAVPVVLIIIQPDFGTAATFFP